jgi:hypothetical protein
MSNAENVLGSRGRKVGGLDRPLRELKAIRDCGGVHLNLNRKSRINRCPWSPLAQLLLCRCVVEGSCQVHDNRLLRAGEIEAGELALPFLFLRFKSQLVFRPERH